jgi:tripartite-type tricarboxylate transporter receptor subunit TctC
MKHAARTLLAGLALIACAGTALAQAWPARPVKIIVPYTPGGVSDLFSRILAQQMQESLGQPFLVENRPGASQMVGAMAVARAPADGHTFLLGSTTSIALNPHTQKSIQYDPLKDFAPVSLAMTMPLFLVVNPAIPATSVKELVALLKANPDRYTYASVGNGSSLHLAGEMFKTLTGTQMRHVPYKGSAPGIADIVAGLVSLSFDPGASSLPSVKAGRLRALAVTSTVRTSLMPDLPTVAEAGVPGYEAGVWFGMLAPAGTPAAVVARFSQEMNRILRLQSNRERFVPHAVELTPNTPEEFGALIRNDIARYAKVLKDAGVQPE